MVDWVGGRLLQAGHNIGRRGQVGVADAEADYVDTRLLDFSFQTVEFGKKIRRQQS
jgi:hypothetical protein